MLSSLLMGNNNVAQLPVIAAASSGFIFWIYCYFIFAFRSFDYAQDAQRFKPSLRSFDSAQDIQGLLINNHLFAVTHHYWPLRWRPVARTAELFFQPGLVHRYIH